MKTIVFTLLTTSMLCTIVHSQNAFPSSGAAGIGTTTPDASSLLEVKSTSKGVSVPGMTVTQRNTISNPATVLLIFQTNATPGFYYYIGVNWAAASPKGVNKTLSNLTAPIGCIGLNHRVHRPNFTITNSSPDQTVTLTGTGATTVIGRYPNFTIHSTDSTTTYTVENE
jgi:hypothetical protein